MGLLVKLPPIDHIRESDRMIVGKYILGDAQVGQDAELLENDADLRA